MAFRSVVATCDWTATSAKRRGRYLRASARDIPEDSPGTGGSERLARGALRRCRRLSRASAPGLTERRRTPRTVAAFRPWRSWRADALRDLGHAEDNHRATDGQSGLCPTRPGGADFIRSGDAEPGRASVTSAHGATPSAARFGGAAAGAGGARPPTAPPHREGADQRGGGGGGGYAGGANGGSGIVIIRYPTIHGNGTGGDSVYIVGSDRVHEFHNNGTFTLTLF